MQTVVIHHHACVAFQFKSNLVKNKFSYCSCKSFRVVFPILFTILTIKEDEKD